LPQKAGETPTIEYVCIVYIVKSHFMRQIVTFLLFGMVFCAIPALAQQNTVTVGTFILPTGDFTVAHGALGFYRQVSGHQAMGLKAIWVLHLISIIHQKIAGSFCQCLM
jgi:hypothetical protein